MSGKNNHYRSHHLKTYPAKAFPKNNILPIDRGGIKSFQYQRLPEIKKHKSNAKNGRTQ